MPTLPHIHPTTGTRMAGSFGSALQQHLKGASTFMPAPRRTRAGRRHRQPLPPLLHLYKNANVEEDGDQRRLVISSLPDVRLTLQPLFPLSCVLGMVVSWECGSDHKWTNKKLGAVGAGASVPR